MKFQYEEKFTRLKEQAAKSYTLRGSTLIVELVPLEEVQEKSLGKALDGRDVKIYMAQDSKQRLGSIKEHALQYGKVLLAGEGYIDEDGNTSPTDIKEGAIVILPKYATSQISVFPGINEPIPDLKLCMVKEPDVLFYYPTVEAFELAKGVLNA